MDRRDTSPSVVIVVALLALIGLAGGIVVLGAADAPVLLGYNVVAGGSGFLLLWHRRQAGRLLLDLGPRNASDLHGRTGIVVVAVCLLFVLKLSPIFALGLLTTMPLALFLQQASRVQVREGGLIVGRRYLPWSRLERLEFEDEIDVVDGLAVTTKVQMRIEYTPCVLSLGCVTVPLFPEDRDEVLNLWSQHVSVRTTRKPSPVSTPSRRLK